MRHPSTPRILHPWDPWNPCAKIFLVHPFYRMMQGGIAKSFHGYGLTKTEINPCRFSEPFGSFAWRRRPLRERAHDGPSPTSELWRARHSENQQAINRIKPLTLQNASPSKRLRRKTQTHQTAYAAEHKPMKTLTPQNAAP